MKIKSILWVAATAASLLGSTYMGQAQTKENTVMVGGAPMYPSKNIIENAVNSKDHTTLVAAVKAAGLVETLEGPGPFTVLAPTNNAFAKVPKEALDNLMLPKNKAQLTSVLTYHVIPGKWSAAQITKAIKDGKGTYVAKSVQGGNLTFWLKGKDVYVKDAQGNSAKVTVADVNQSNGVIHVIDAVLMP
ncbi:fasciclin domain-containing protein [Sphingobacterium sp.]|uniref:fasciclin domain-containing protein n=1 Tax=Sphingobacterium sp. TaxID=341027 RepID=UPI002FDC7E2E